MAWHAAHCLNLPGKGMSHMQCDRLERAFAGAQRTQAHRLQQPLPVAWKFQASPGFDSTTTALIVKRPDSLFPGTHGHNHRSHKLRYYGNPRRLVTRCYICPTGHLVLPLSYKAQECFSTKSLNMAPTVLTRMHALLTTLHACMNDHESCESCPKIVEIYTTYRHTDRLHHTQHDLIECGRALLCTGPDQMPWHVLGRGSSTVVNLRLIRSASAVQAA